MMPCPIPVRRQYNIYGSTQLSYTRCSQTAKKTPGFSRLRMCEIFPGNRVILLFFCVWITHSLVPRLARSLLRGRGVKRHIVCACTNFTQISVIRKLQQSSGYLQLLRILLNDSTYVRFLVMQRAPKTKVKVLDEANSLCTLSHGLEKAVYLHIKQQQIETGLGQLLY